MGKELRENAPAARGSKEAEFMQFLTDKSSLLSVLAYGYRSPDCYLFYPGEA